MFDTCVLVKTAGAGNCSLFAGPAPANSHVIFDNSLQSFGLRFTVNYGQLIL
jgi:hypothetical protein